MLHRTNMTARLSCLVCAAVLAAGLVCAVLSCDGIGSSINSDSNPYGGMGGSGGSGSGSVGSGSTGTGNFTVEDLFSLSNAGDVDAILVLLSGTGENQSADGTFTVELSADDISLPAGGTVTLTITGSSVDYSESAGASADGKVTFEVARIAVGTTVTVTLTVRAADGSIAATGTKTQLVTEGVCDFHVTMTDTAPAPAPAPVPAGFVAVTGATVSGQIADSQVFIAGRTITIRNLYVCAHEVTQEEYTAVMGSNPSNFTGSPAAGEEQSKRPVEKVSWYDALVYCNKRSMAEGLTACYTISGSTDPDDWGAVPTNSDATWNAVVCDFDADGYRLPTEAEWENAASDGHTYSGSNTVGDVAWYISNSGSKTHEVKTKAPNTKGIYDMSGNVNEWCWDSTTLPNRVLRGGSWGNPDTACAVSSPHNNGLPNYRGTSQGFRLVLKAP